MNVEKELEKFVTNPGYRVKVIQKVHKEQDAAYSNRINALEKQKNALMVSRKNEITRIEKSRLEVVCPNFAVNRTEGYVLINQGKVPFDTINGAQVNFEAGNRIISQTNTKARRRASLGGAVVGGMMFGAAGAIVGAAANGKTKGKSRTVTQSVATCNHIGVLVDVNGFVQEIQIFQGQIDQNTGAFRNHKATADRIVALLSELASTPVPTSFIPVEKEQSVLNINKQINEKATEIKTATEDKPTYALPDMYRTAEQREMTDADYIAYLEQEDQNRREMALADKDEKARAKAEKKALAQQEKLNKINNSDGPVVKSVKYREPIERGNGPVLGIGWKITFWILSVSYVLWGLMMLIFPAPAAMIVYCLSGLFVNPLIFGLITNKLVPIPKWVCIIVVVVGFILGMILMVATAPTQPVETTAAVMTFMKTI